MTERVTQSFLTPNRRAALFFLAYVAVFWGILAFALVSLITQPLSISGRSLSSHPFITTDQLTILFSFVGGILNAGLQFALGGVLERDLITRLCQGVPMLKLDRSWLALAGKLKLNVSRYTFLILNGILGAAFISAQFRIFSATKRSSKEIGIAGVTLDRPGGIPPYYQPPSKPSYSPFFGAMENAIILPHQPYHSDTPPSTLWNSIARLAEGTVLFQHESTFGANHDVVELRPILGVTSGDETIQLCAQTFKPDAITCRFYTEDDNAISEFSALGLPPQGFQFHLTDPAIEADNDFSSMNEKKAAAVMWNLTEGASSGDHVVLFASIAAADWIGTIGSGFPFSNGQPPALVSGSCKIAREPFQLSPITFRRDPRSSATLMAASQDSASLACPNIDPDINTLGWEVALHVANLIVPPTNVQMIDGLGMLLKSKLLAATQSQIQTMIYGSSERLSYTVRALLAAGIASSMLEDGTETRSTVGILSTWSYFGVPKLNPVLGLLLLPIATTLIGTAFAVRILLRRAPRINFDLFSLSRLLVIPASNGFHSKSQAYGQGQADTKEWQRMFSSETGLIGIEIDGTQTLKFGPPSEVKRLNV